MLMPGASWERLVSWDDLSLGGGKLLLSFALIGIFPLIAKRLVGWFRSRRVYKGYRRPHQYDYNMIVIGGGAAVW